MEKAQWPLLRGNRRQGGVTGRSVGGVLDERGAVQVVAALLRRLGPVAECELFAQSAEDAVEIKVARQARDPVAQYSQ